MLNKGLAMLKAHMGTKFGSHNMKYIVRDPFSMPLLVVIWREFLFIHAPYSPDLDIFIILLILILPS